MGKVRKAVAGGLTGGLAAVVAGFTFTGEPTKAQAVQLATVFFGGFVVGFAGVWSAPANAPE